ncbi:hypothetical protein AMATHDRAFT_47172 [Amanita thiersii Skay4041]|uniref:DH domain-containing protein n=1 Tax=Amanita thiersii Skay4041 TaxID=703135 RepID=A0A2A9NL49_9AGAR|nr:hypothetical protein AMATHDRAFT_47172 [Amanita thiersii Skay4041]
MNSNSSHFLPLPSLSQPASLLYPLPLSTSSLQSPPLNAPPALTQYATAPNSPVQSLPIPLISPTWKSTPPTPPPSSKRSLTVSRVPTLPLSSSASFPALGSPPIPFKVPQLTQGFVAPCPLVLRRPRSLSDSSLHSRRATYASTVVASRKHDGNDTKFDRPRKFHIYEGSTAEIDEGYVLVESPEHTNDESSSDGHDSDAVSNEFYDNILLKDGTRRFHALKEILMTEVGYLFDLKIIMAVFLQNISTLTYCNRPSTWASTSFTATSWMGSFSHSPLSSLPSSSSFVPDSCFSISSNKQHSQQVQRCLFSEDELNSLTRNFEDILHFHERFVQKLKELMQPFGIALDSQIEPFPLQNGFLSRLDGAIQLVTHAFKEEESRFHIYQDFCAGHSEALEIIRKKQQQHPVEWDSFERLCATEITTKRDKSTNGSSVLALSSRSCQDLPVRTKTRSLSHISLDGEFHSARASTTQEYGCSRRLTFMDYLIKPVQRICRYPLLLDQLRPIRACKGALVQLDALVEEATLAMRRVVMAVDEARHRRDAAAQSSLIAFRILLSSPQLLSHDFLTSLGTCLLAGSLDVIHYPLERPPGNVKSKYLGAFLYPGGYLILVKVSKGKVYEPRHWFCLSDCDVRDITEDIALLSYSFCISSSEHLFELAAACLREKNIWLSSIRESLAQTPTWCNEPMSSLGLDNESGTCLDASPTEMPTNPDVDQRDEGVLAPSEPLNVRKGNPMKQDSIFSCRATSSTSVKAMFAPDPDNLVVRRTSSLVRQHTNQGLQDILSTACLIARAGAQSHKELFQEPRGTDCSVSRSNSTLSVAGLTKSRLLKHRTVKISRHNSLPNGTSCAARRELLKAKSMIVSRRSLRKSLTTPALSEKDGRSNCSMSSGSAYNNPSDPLPSRSSSALDHIRSVFLSSDAVNARAEGPRRFVNNVRGLFRSRSTTTSPTEPNFSRHEWQLPGPGDQQPNRGGKSPTGNLFRQLSLKASFHFRRRSVPEDTTTRCEDRAGLAQLAEEEFGMNASSLTSSFHDTTQPPQKISSN